MMWWGVILATAFALVKISVCGPCTVPGPPKDLNILNITSRTLSISWKRPDDDGNCTQLKYVVFLRANGKCWEEMTEKNTTATLQVKPYRTYDIFVMAHSDVGYGMPSVRVSNTTTLEAEPESCPKIISFEHSNNDIGILWSEIPEDDHNGIIIGHKIFYKNISMVNETVVDVPIANATDYYDVPNIIGSGFEFRVAAYTSVGLCKGFKDLKRKPDVELKSTACPTLPQQTTTQISHTPATSTVGVTTSMMLTPTLQPTTPQTERTTEPTDNTQEPGPSSTQEPTEPNTKEPGEKLASTKEKSWLLYVAIALAIIVVIMGVSVFILIWQLYKNHRFYKLSRREQYALSAKNNIGTDNQAQDNHA